MRLQDILVCLDPTDAGEGRLRLAAGLASDHRAHLSAAYVLPEQIAGAGGYADYGGLGFRAPAGAAAIAPGSLVAGVPAPAAPPAVEGDYARRLELTDIVKQRFRESVQPHGIAGDWQLFGAGESADLLVFARAADLVIYGQESPEYRLPTGYDPEDVLMASGRPLLVVPYAGNFTTIGQRVLLAWDGSREAARAAHDALPLLDKAAAVTLITVGDSEADAERHRPGVDRMLRNLERHGLRARAEEARRGGMAVSDVLLSRAADFGADLIVAGAYHHSQLRESVFGGVTRELLDRMTVPVLMSH